MDPAIVIPAFRRPEALKRLLSSIRRARIPKGTPLILSLEKEATQDVVDVATSFVSSDCDVSIRVHERQLGLHDHLLYCGDLSTVYGSVVVLEDDILVDPFFYDYAAAALSFYSDAPNIAGIALYSPE